MVIFLRSWLVLLPMAVIARAATSATVAQHIELTFSFFVETGVVPLVQAAALAWGLAACPWPSFSRALPRLWRPTHVVVGSITAAVLVVVLLRGSTGELAGVGVGRAASVLAGVELIVAAGLWYRAMGRLGRRVLPLVSIAAGAGVLATLDPGWLLEVADVRLPHHFVGAFVWGACGVLLVVAVLVAAPVLSTTARALALSAGLVTAIAVSLLTVIDFLHVFYLGRQFDLQRLALVLVAGLFLIAAAEREGGDVAETRLGAELDRVDWPWMVLLLMAGALAARGALSLVLAGSWGWSREFFAASIAMAVAQSCALLAMAETRRWFSRVKTSGLSRRVSGSAVAALLIAADIALSWPLIAAELAPESEAWTWLALWNAAKLTLAAIYAGARRRQRRPAQRLTHLACALVAAAGLLGVATWQMPVWSCLLLVGAHRWAPVGDGKPHLRQAVAGAFLAVALVIPVAGAILAVQASIVGQLLVIAIVSPASSLLASLLLTTVREAPNQRQGMRQVADRSLLDHQDSHQIPGAGLSSGLSSRRAAKTLPGEMASRQFVWR